MSRVEILSRSASIDFDLSVNDDNESGTLIRSQEDRFNLPSHRVLSGTLSTSPILGQRLNENYNKIDDSDDINICIPQLPPLFRGHPEVHLRNGVMRASRLAAVHEPDAEKAFFVADLSYVYAQHERWMKYLPDIMPFYGMFSCYFNDYLLTPLQQRSNATRIRMFCAY